MEPFFFFQIFRVPTVSVMWCFVTYSDGAQLLRRGGYKHFENFPLISRISNKFLKTSPDNISMEKVAVA